MLSDPERYSIQHPGGPGTAPKGVLGPDCRLFQVGAGFVPSEPSAYYVAAKSAVYAGRIFAQAMPDLTVYDPPRPVAGDFQAFILNDPMQYLVF